jgi:hypothetical protein
MPRLATVGSTQIRVYADDTRKHKQPHFHAASPDGGAVISLPELDVIAGSVKNIDAVIGWAPTNENLRKLLDAWDLGNPTMKIRW